jgi:hypothetical protein
VGDSFNGYGTMRQYTWGSLRNHKCPLPKQRTKPIMVIPNGG